MMRVLSSGNAATRPSCETIGWITLTSDAASMFLSLIIRVTYESPRSSPGSCEVVSAADSRTSREGTIFITGPACIVVNPLTWSTDWKME